MPSKDITKDICDEFKERVEMDFSIPVIEALLSILENEQSEKDDVVVNNILNLLEVRVNEDT